MMFADHQMKALQRYRCMANKIKSDDSIEDERKEHRLREIAGLCCAVANIEDGDSMAAEAIREIVYADIEPVQACAKFNLFQTT